MTEFQLQLYVVGLLRYNAAPGVVYYSVPNGENRSAITGARLKKAGVRAGVADMAFVLPPNGKSAFLELKAGKGRLSELQRQFEWAATKAGALFAVAWTPEEAKEILRGWGAIRKDSA